MEIRLDRKLVVAFVALAAAPWLIASSIEAVSGEDNNTRIDIVGTGQVPQEVQLLTMQAGVNSFATSASRAIAQNSATLAQIRKQLARHGVDPKDVRTNQFGLTPSTESSSTPGGSSIKGYEVRHTLTIVFRDVTKTGPVMDVLVGAGANQISGPMSSWDATPEAQQVARTAAIRDAEQRAQFYAKTLGLKVKRVVNMRDGGGYASRQPMPSRAAIAEATEILPGVDRVQVQVVAQYELMR